MRQLLSVAVSLGSIVGTASAQVDPLSLAVDEDGRLFMAGVSADLYWYEVSDGTGVPPGFTIVSLGSNGSLGSAYGVARNNTTGVDHLAELTGVPWFDDPKVSPIGFPNIQGLTVTSPGVVLAVSVDEGVGATTLVTIDRETGVGTTLGAAHPGLALVGLASLDERVFAISREAGGAGASKLYEVDTSSGSLTFREQLPIAAESLSRVSDGTGRCLLALGHGACLVCVFPEYTWVSVMDVSPPGLPVIIAAMDVLEYVPVTRQSWSSIKARYR